MKITLLRALLSCMLVVFIAACGNEKKPAEEAEKPKPSDIFKEEHSAYDPKAINPDAEVISITLKAEGNSMADMHYDQKTISVKSGSTVKLKFINTAKDEAMPHNWVLVYDGTMETVAAAGLAAGKDNSFVPASNDVLIATKLLGPGEETEITFAAPPAGKYQFVCTYPGHWSIMNGVFEVN